MPCVQDDGAKLAHTELYPLGSLQYLTPVLDWVEEGGAAYQGFISASKRETHGSGCGYEYHAFAEYRRLRVKE